MEASPAIAKGTEIDGVYRLTRVLGQGGMGAVWEAEHLRLPKRVAIKFLLGAFASRPELVHRFRREAEIASRLRHPNIVEVHDFNTLPGGTPYLVMEYLEGTSLRDRLERGLLAMGDVREVLRQVVSALALAHRERVVHRDLKPENIFLCDDPDGAVRVKVLDFGISKADDASSFATVEGALLGTPAYMAPEQAMGKHSALDGRTDLFALAAIAYEMLSGRIAFGGNTLIEVVNKVTNHSPEPLDRVVPHVPSSVSTAVERALSKDPDQRQASVQEFFSAFSAQLPRGPTADRPLAWSAAESPRGAGAEHGETESEGIHETAPDYRTGGTSLRMAVEGPTRAMAAKDLSLATTLPPPLSPVHAQGSYVQTSAGYQQVSHFEAPARAPRTGLRVGLGIALAVGVAVGGALAFGGGSGGQNDDRLPEPDRSIEPREASVNEASVVEPRAKATEPDASASTREATSANEAKALPPDGPSANEAKALPPDGPSANEAKALLPDGPSASEAKALPPDGPSASERNDAAAGLQDREDAARASPRTGKDASTNAAASPGLASAGSSEALREARTALERGAYDEAVRLGRKDLQREKSPEVYELLAKAHCGQRDVGMAQAMLRNLNRGAQARVREFCRKHDVTPG